jgi:hypothetical protein
MMIHTWLFCSIFMVTIVGRWDGSINKAWGKENESCGVSMDSIAVVIE